MVPTEVTERRRSRRGISGRYHHGKNNTSGYRDDRTLRTVFIFEFQELSVAVVI